MKIRSYRRQEIDNVRLKRLPGRGIGILNEADHRYRLRGGIGDKYGLRGRGLPAKAAVEANRLKQVRAMSPKRLAMILLFIVFLLFCFGLFALTDAGARQS